MPYGSSAEDNRVAADYMMRNYPDWVQSWIHEKGGLTRSMKTMRYGYAAQFIKPCDIDKRKKSRSNVAMKNTLGR
ncbi:MAG: hypothetical protein GY789_22265 [Hyphomicrobiales bacterium]|nr:hypothetical protein [Hyphomicrobiales bacterium]MCP5000179.1 hypothetical protein [Hyphomicrobiales bacterium]